MTAADDALDRLVWPEGDPTSRRELVATVREELQRLREVEAAHEHLSSEYHFDQDRGDHLVYRREWDAFNAWQRGDLSFEKRALTAEAARDEYLRETERLQKKLEAAEAAVRRYKEGLREIEEMGDYVYKPHEFAEKARALLADSPPDGGGAK